ncbi:hypothetical protein [Desulfogranum japonicum]|uniref:hypothetical protein n=1 Tax=Desulfogranum japonicum TaxID=231447 RepID=UPI000490ECB9|nr:hypothetical protein [Desulfogranum japonicum]
MQFNPIPTTPVTIATRNTTQKTATHINTETFTLQKDDSPSSNSENFALPNLAAYQNQLSIQGKQEQSMVITRDGTIVGSISQENFATFQDSALAGLWDKVHGDTDIFSSTLKKAGYDIAVYEQGKGPTYAEIHEQIHGESYDALIARQSIEYIQEKNQLTDKLSYLNVIA